MYYLSLSPINSSSMKCFRKRNLYCIMTIAKLVFASSCLMLFTFYVIFYRKIYLKFHLFIIIILYIYLFYKDQNVQIVKHGFYNFIGFIIITILLIIIASYSFILRCLFKKSRSLMIFLFMAPFPFLFILLNVYKRNHFFCIEWDKGLNHTFIDNDSKDYPCKINIPKNNTCLISEIGHLLDFTSLYRPTCKNIDYIKSQIRYFRRSLDSLANNISYYNISRRKFFGYPLTNNENYSYNICGTLVSPSLKNLETELHKNIILMDLFLKNRTLYYKDEPTPEVLVNLRAKKDKVIVKIKKNKTLVKERKKLSRKLKSSRLFENVLVIFFDTVSRAHFFRKFKKTVRFLEQFTKYEEDYNKKNMTVFQFLKYHSLNSFTNPNIKAAYFGSKFDGNGTHFANYFQENGYITAQSQNMCSKESFEIDPDYIHMSDLEIDEYDHENIAMFCEPNYAEIDNPTPVFTGPYGILRRCLAGFDSFNYMIEYGKQFWQKYKGNKKYLRLNFQDAHEFTGQVVKYLDEPLFNFLNNLYKTNDLKDTALFFISDHGNSYFNYFYYYVLKSDDSLIERGFATLFIILPNYKNNKSEELLNNINIKQQAFITPFDIHDTIMHIAYGDNLQFNNILYSQKGNSLITNFEYKTRKCENWFLYFKANEDCICLNGFGNKKIVNRFPKKN